MEEITNLNKFQRSWTLWFDTNWLDLKNRGIFDNIQSFWQIFNNLKPIAQMENKSSIRIFETGIHPSREDIQNINGGRWILQYYSKCDIDETFKEIMMDVCGETLMKYEIAGVELNVQEKGHRIAFWTKNCNPLFGDYLNKTYVDGVFSIVFKKHEEILKHTATFKKK